MLLPRHLTKIASADSISVEPPFASSTPAPSQLQSTPQAQSFLQTPIQAKTTAPAVSPVLSSKNNGTSVQTTQAIQPAQPTPQAVQPTQPVQQVTPIQVPQPSQPSQSLQPAQPSQSSQAIVQSPQLNPDPQKVDTQPAGQAEAMKVLQNTNLEYKKVVPPTPSTTEVSRISSKSQYVRRHIFRKLRIPGLPRRPAPRPT